MAQPGEFDLHRESVSCPICLDLLTDPVSLGCGHNYCMGCIQGHWDVEDEKCVHSCPQCRKVFTPRPALEKNTMLADLVEQLKRTGVRATPAEHCYAGPEDVACDVCTGRKLKALKSCLVCVASYCERHLQPHYDVGPLKKHRLAEPTEKIHENICSRHNEALKIFCRTDQRLICYLCLMDEHEGHETVSAVEERKEKQQELQASRQSVRQGIQDRKKEVKALQKKFKAINRSANKAVQHSEKTFAELIRLIQERSSEVKQQLRAKQETEAGRVKELQEKLEREIVELKREGAELKKLSTTKDNNQFLHNYTSLSPHGDHAHSSGLDTRPLRHFDDVTAAVSEAGDKLRDVLTETWTNISRTVSQMDVLQQQPEPKTRADFLRYSREIALDPNTAQTHLLLSDGNTRATVTTQEQPHSSHTDRFTPYRQVLSKEGLSGRCYWEVQWSGYGVYIAVAYKNINRAGPESRFGYNDKSWALYCDRDGSSFRHDKVNTPVSSRPSSRIGVYLDHKAGTLSFYSVSESVTLLHRVQTTFTEPLYAGVNVYGSEFDTAEFVKLK